MIQRPRSVTAIAWILIVASLFAIYVDLDSSRLLYRTPGQTHGGSPLSFNLKVLAIVEMLVWIVCGYFMLKGKSLARYAFILPAVAHNVYGIVTSDVKLPLLMGILLWIIAGYFLFYRSEARAFFADNGAHLDTPVWPPIRTALSVVFYVLAGFFFCSTGFIVFFATIKPIARLIMFSLMQIPALMTMAIGMALSIERNWLRDFGTVFLSVAGVYAFLLLAIVLNYIDPMSQGFALSTDSASTYDAVTGCTWVMLMGIVGGLLLWASKDFQSQSH